MDIPSNYHSSFHFIHLGWQVGFTSPEFQGETDISIKVPPEGIAKLTVKRKRITQTSTKSRRLLKEELDHLHAIFASSTFCFDQMPSLACDAATSKLIISGECWMFSFEGMETGCQPGMAAFNEALRDLYTPILDELNEEIKAKLVADGDYHNLN